MDTVDGVRGGRGVARGKGEQVKLDNLELKRELEAKLAEWLLSFIEPDMLHELMLESELAKELDESAFWDLHDWVIAQRQQQRIQLTVVLPHGDV
jgi:hypothetical protein